RLGLRPADESDAASRTDDGERLGPCRHTSTAGGTPEPGPWAVVELEDRRKRLCLNELEQRFPAEAKHRSKDAEGGGDPQGRAGLQRRPTGMRTGDDLDGPHTTSLLARGSVAGARRSHLIAAMSTHNCAKSTQEWARRMKGDDVPVSMLTDQVESYRLVQRLLRSFLDGKPEDVFYVEEPAVD